MGGREAPVGFTRETWRRFAADGILVIEDALSPQEVEDLAGAIVGLEEQSAWNIVELDGRFSSMIDHPAHVGHVYDVYGEMLKLVRSEYFKRDPGEEIRNRWHFDGPRVLPFDVFSKELPLRIKVGYWLTPLSRPDSGNLVYIPGSHRRPYLPEYHTHEAYTEERQLIVRPGAMTLMWGGLWHRVAENRSERTRLNLFLEYAPSWLTTSDRLDSDPDWLAGLSREQQIIMRNYGEPNNFIKLPDEDVPLFLPRAGEADPDSQHYHSVVPLALRKRSTWAEKQGLL